MAAILSRRAPFLLRAGFKQRYGKLPDSALGLLKGPDSEVVKIPWVEELVVTITSELFANPDGFIEEVRLLCKPWDLTPGVVRASLWTREFDRMHPPSHARRVAEILGGDPCVTVVPGGRAVRAARDLRGHAAIRDIHGSVKHQAKGESAHEHRRSGSRLRPLDVYPPAQ